MLIELILGAIFGTVAVIALGIWYSRQKGLKEATHELEGIDRDSRDQRPLLLDLPIEKKLRDALYEAEKGEEKCWREALELYHAQEELLQNLGRPSYVQLSQKDLFFELTHPKTLEKRFYYQRDLKKERTEEFFQESKALLQAYQEHIDILTSKIQFFKKLQTTHQEQLAQIEGIQQQQAHWQKLKEHQQKLEQLSKNTDIEVQSLRHKALLEEIERELEFQQECLKQYQELSDQFDSNLDENLAKNIKINIQNLINQIDNDMEE